MENEERQEEKQEKQGDPEIERRAVMYGWSPKEEFRGDPAKWVPAEVFVERAENILPIARSMNKKLESDLTMTKKELEEAKKAIKAVIQAHKKNADTTYESRVTQIEQAQIKAVSEGNSEEWARLETEKKKLEKPAEIQFEEKPNNNGDAEVLAQWKRDNEWYEKDAELGTYADSVANFITTRSPGLPPSDFLQKVKDEVQKRFPDKFGNPNRRKPPAVDRSDYSSGGGGNDSGKKTYSDLPKDAKDACDALVAQKVLTREQYVKTYYEA